jgi:Tol biopolymer transport system component
MCKRINTEFTVFFFLALFTSCQNNNSIIPIDVSFGLKPPGDSPEVFAPDLISSKEPVHGHLVFSPDQKEIFWSVSTNNYKTGKILTMRFENGNWSTPKIAPFSGKYRDLHPSISYDGNKIFFFSYRPLEVGGDSIYSIWSVERQNDFWSEPKPLNKYINAGFANGGQSFSLSGKIYFWSAREGSWGGCDIYTSNFENNEFIESEKLGVQINSDYMESCTWISPDESYLIFDSNRPDGFGSWDLYISYKGTEGSWIKARNMGEQINSEKSDWFSSVSPDGKYLFFVSNRNGNDDVYWVDARIIEDLKPNGLK